MFTLHKMEKPDKFLRHPAGDHKSLKNDKYYNFTISRKI